MQEAELKQLIKDDKVEAVDSQTQPPKDSEKTKSTVDNIDDLVVLLRQLKRNLSVEPSETPKNYLEQIQLYNDDLYLFVDKDTRWKPIGVSKCATGRTSRSTGEGTGTQKISIGFRPKLIKITAVGDGNNSGMSWGTYTLSASNGCLAKNYDGTNWISNSYSYIIYVWNSGGTSNGQASISSIDDTSFTLNWTQMAMTTNFIWEAYG